MTTDTGRGVGEEQYRRPPAEDEEAEAKTLKGLFTQTLHAPMRMLLWPKPETFWDEIYGGAAIEVLKDENISMVGEYRGSFRVGMHSRGRCEFREAHQVTILGYGGKSG